MESFISPIFRRYFSLREKLKYKLLKGVEQRKMLLFGSKELSGFTEIL